MKRYLNKFYPIYDWNIVRNFFYDNPIQAKVILKDFSKSNEAKMKEVAWLFIEGKSKIVYIVGARGSGKTASCFMFAETVHNETGRSIFYISPSANKKALPDWCKLIETIQDAPKGCLAMVDESAIQFNARDFMQKENVDMTKLLAIARHKDIFLIFLTQDTALADTNIRRLRDIILWKQSNDYGLTEKGAGNQKEHKFWQKVRNMMSPRSKPEVLFEYPAKRRFIHFSHELPECWSDNLSKVWANATFGKDKTSDEKGGKNKHSPKDIVAV